MNPLYATCHLCHASVGQPCRFGLSGDEVFHERRVKHAERGGDGIETQHGLAHGSLCTRHGEGSEGWKGICMVCGQSISRLKAIPVVLEKFRKLDEAEQQYRRLQGELQRLKHLRKTHHDRVFYTDLVEKSRRLVARLREGIFVR